MVSGVHLAPQVQQAQSAFVERVASLVHRVSLVVSVSVVMPVLRVPRATLVHKGRAEKLEFLVLMARTVRTERLVKLAVVEMAACKVYRVSLDLLDLRV